VEVSLAPLQTPRRRILAQLVAVCLAQQQLPSQLKRLAQPAAVFSETSLQRHRQREEECLAMLQPTNSRQQLAEEDYLEAPLQLNKVAWLAVAFSEASLRRHRQREEECLEIQQTLSSQEVVSLALVQLRLQTPQEVDF
jgi:hypothetical protein